MVTTKIDPKRLRLAQRVIDGELADLRAALRAFEPHEQRSLTVLSVIALLLDLPASEQAEAARLLRPVL